MPNWDQICYISFISDNRHYLKRRIRIAGTLVGYFHDVKLGDKIPHSYPNALLPFRGVSLWEPLIHLWGHQLKE